MCISCFMFFLLLNYHLLFFIFILVFYLMSKKSFCYTKIFFARKTATFTKLHKLPTKFLCRGVIYGNHTKITLLSVAPVNFLFSRFCRTFLKCVCIVCKIFLLLKKFCTPQKTQVLQTSHISSYTLGHFLSAWVQGDTLQKIAVGFVIIYSVIILYYLPTQNFSNIRVTTSSLAVVPVISPNACQPSLISKAIQSRVI